MLGYLCNGVVRSASCLEALHATDSHANMCCLQNNNKFNSTIFYFLVYTS